MKQKYSPLNIKRGLKHGEYPHYFIFLITSSVTSTPPEGTASLISTALRFFSLDTSVNAVSRLYVPNRVEMLAEEFYQWPMWSVVLLIGVIGPLSEELCFRGFILQNLRSSGRAAASVTGGVFTLRITL